MSEFDFDARAAQMYGQQPTSNKTDTPRQPTAEDQQAARLFPEMRTSKPDTSPRALQPNLAPTSDPMSDERAERMFDGAGSHGDAQRSIERGMLDALASPEEVAAAVDQSTEIFQAYRLTATESATVAGLGMNVHNAPATDEVREQWASDARNVLVQDYGAGAGQALADAKALVAGDAQLRQFLNRTGLGDHPVIVRLAAQKARALRASGRL